MAYELLGQALIAGISLEYFWDNTYANIVLLVQAYVERQKIESQRKAINDYKLAQLIGSNVSILFASKKEIDSGKCKIPTIQEIYPDLFGDEIPVSLPEPNKTIDSEQSREGDLSAAEVNFLAGMIALQNQRNKEKQLQQTNKE